MQGLFDSPFTTAIIAGVITAIISACLARALRQNWLVSVGAVFAFLAAYYETYQKVPSFPPVGAANKVFYVAAFAGLFGAAWEWIVRVDWARPVLALATSIGVAAWIGWTKFADPDALTYALAGEMAIGGAVFLGALDGLARANGAAGLASLAAVAALAAPTALFGGSSTSVGLCLGAMVGLAALSLDAFLARRSLSACAVMGVGGALLAALDVIALITRKADPPALLLIALAPIVGLAVVRLLPASWRASPLTVWLAGGLATLSPLPVILALLFLRHDNPLG